MSDFPAVIVGAGQAGLATAYYLRKLGIEPVLLDNQLGPGGAWQQYWESLTLFSSAGFSNLPGMPMPAYDGFPPRDHVIDYFTAWEERYKFDIRRPVNVSKVDHNGELFEVTAGVVSSGQKQVYTADNVVMATGNWSSPFVPAVPGSITGQMWHSANYPGKDTFRGTRVAVVGGANSGAQIAAELTEVADVIWLTTHEPRWMPDDVDGSVLFKRNRERYLAISRGEADPGGVENLGDIVMVPPVLRARNEGRLKATPMVDSLDELDVDHLIWCTGFRPSVGPVRHLLNGYAPKVEGLYLIGFSQANGPGADTIMGVSPFAKQAASSISKRLNHSGE
ncbi:NAD(P)-binding domain-containing protein [Corynebacterium breve]|uniref:NAD(P)-binding domain-containing protein n=1 Tax=Corynebacterium breve TaxID=3049799 RepID=A0ABY8VDM3_9CORY|nr:NAD(P)-binding domain-containing protein [Corynebacterium breve]WIM67603.1 NAD(P)-binding domain-containing protein [Corynebacterium breve]